MGQVWYLIASLHDLHLLTYFYINPYLRHTVYVYAFVYIQIVLYVLNNYLIQIIILVIQYICMCLDTYKWVQCAFYLYNGFVQILSWPYSI